jgi:predicted HTH transcriptional regulator
MPKGSIEVAAALVVGFAAMYEMKIGVFVAVGVLIALAIFRFREEEGHNGKNNINVERAAGRQENIARVLVAVKETRTITNNEVEELLGVSDGAAESYLNELQAQGVLEQVGGTGRSVMYRIK